MADLHHNLSLADALTEPPPEIEEEVKRDFIATLEAEKFDDVVGETVDKTDYVPLLDDEEARAGSQEAKGKGHPEGAAVEHTSASGPMVVENGDHGIEDHHTVFPGDIMDEKLSYKEFLDRSESWPVDDRELCLEPQPVFQPLEVAATAARDPFSMHRGENLPDLSFPADMKNVPLFTDHTDSSRDIHAPHGSMVIPEQPFLGPLYSPAEALDPSAFMGLDSSAEYLQDRAVPEEHWMGAQPEVKGPDTSFFVQPPDAVCVPGSDAVSVPAEGAGSILAGDNKPPQALDAGFGPAAGANPFQVTDVGFAAAPEAKPPNAANAAPAPVADVGFTPAADATSHYTVDLEFAPAADAGFAPAADAQSHHGLDSEFASAADIKPHHAVDSEFAPAADAKPHHGMDSEFAPAADAKPHHTVDSEFSPAADTKPHHGLDSELAPAAEVNHHHAMDSGFAALAEAKPLPAMDSGFGSAEAKSDPAAATKAAASEKLVASESSLEQDRSPFDKPPAEATANTEQESKAPEVCAGLLEKAKDSKPPPSQHEEHPEQTNHLSEPAAPAEAKEAVALENKNHLPEKGVPAPEEQEEGAEHNHVQHTEPQQEKALQEPTGLPTAQVRHANTPSEGRFGRAEPAPLPIAHVPEERRVGLPQQKSTEPRAEPRAAGGLGRGAGTAPRTGAPQKEATEQLPAALPASGESCRDLPRESWGLEGSLAVVKKKKKKPKQRRNQPPRAMEPWDENVTGSKAARNSPAAAALQQPDVCPGVPAGKELSAASGSRAAEMPKDVKMVPGSHALGEQSACPVPARAQRGPGPSLVLEPARAVGRTEQRRDASLVVQPEGKRQEAPLEQVGKTKVEESVAVKGPTKPGERRDFPEKHKKREYKESQRAGLTAPLSEVIDLSKAETPFQTRPPKWLLSDEDEEAQCRSPRREAQQGLRVASGAPGAAAESRGGCEGGREAENESFQPPTQLPGQPKAADETNPVAPDKCLADGFRTSAGVLKTPAGAPDTPLTPGVLPDPEEVAALQTRKADGPPEQPFLLSAKPDAAKHPTSAEAGDRMLVADSPDKNKGRGFTVLEQQTGRDPNIAHGMDRAKKKRGEGKVKKMKSSPDQMMLSEDVSKLTDAVRTDETVKEMPYPEKSRGSSARGHPSVSITQPYPADKPKQRGSDGRSKKGERSFYQHPFFESRMNPGSFPDRTDKTKEGGVSDRGRERSCVTAECFQEDTAKTQRPVALVAGEPKGNVGKTEISDLGASHQPFLQESRREEAKSLAVADTISTTKEVNWVTKGKEAGMPPAAVINPDAAAVADRARKRGSDGRRKKPEKSPLGQAAVLDAGVETSNLPGKEKVARSTRDMAFDKDKVPGFERELLLENVTGVTKEVLEKPETQGDTGSSSSQPNLPGHKIETSEPEVVDTKEPGPVNKGKELDRSESLPEPRTDTAGAHSPTRDKSKRRSRDVKGKKAETSLEHSVVLGPGHTPAVGEEVGSAKQTQSLDKGRGTNSSTSGSLREGLSPAAEGQAPAVPLEPEQPHASSKEKCKKMEGNLLQPFVLEHKAAAEMLPPHDTETPDKSEARSPSPCSSGAGAPSREQPALRGHAAATPPDRSAERGCDGSSKKAKSASEQPAFPEPKLDRSEVKPPVGPEMGYGVEDMDLVDENRNIKNFPIGPRMLWNSKGSDFASFAQAAVGGPDNTGHVSSSFPKQTEEGTRGEGLPPPETAAEKSSREPRSGAEETETQKSCKQPIDLGCKEPGKEVSKKGGQTKEAGFQAGSEVGKPVSVDHSIKQDLKSKKDKVCPSPVAKLDDKETRSTEKKPKTDSAPSDLPQKESKVTDSRTRPAPVGAKGTETQEASVCPGEEAPGCSSPAAPGSRAEAAVLQERPGALLEDKAEEAQLGGARKGEQSSLGHPAALDTKVAAAEAAGFSLTAAQTAKRGPQDASEGHAQPAEEDTAGGGDTHLKEAPALKSEIEKPQAKEKEEREQKAVKEAKKERVKAAEQLKGYMRPTKSRGVPALPARSAAPDREKAKQLKPSGGSRPRQERGVCVPGASSTPASLQPAPAPCPVVA